MNGNFSNDGILQINATNLQDFKKLIEKAQKQAEELQNTINQLEFFNLKIKFSINEDDDNV